MTNLRELMRTLFLIYCIYAFYSCLVVFYRPGDRGAIFRSLRIPVVVFIYFLIPCVALYLVYRAFWGIHMGLFWAGVVGVLPLSFCIILYFVTSSEWPVGKVLQLDKVSVPVMLVLLSLNLASSVVVAGVGAVTLGARPHTMEIDDATKTLQKLQGEEKQQQTQLQGLQREATMTVFKKSGDLLNVLLPLITAVITFLTSMLTLGKK